MLLHFALLLLGLQIIHLVLLLSLVVGAIRRTNQMAALMYNHVNACGVRIISYILHAEYMLGSLVC